MTKVAAELGSCGQPDALRRSFVLAVAPALCLDASRATQVHHQHTMPCHVCAKLDLTWRSEAACNCAEPLSCWLASHRACTGRLLPQASA